MRVIQQNQEFFKEMISVLNFTTEQSLLEISAIRLGKITNLRKVKRNALSNLTLGSLREMLIHFSFQVINLLIPNT